MFQMQNGILKCVNQKLLDNGGIDMFQMDDGTKLYQQTLYYNPGYGTKLTVVRQGEVVAEQVFGSIDVMVVYGNEIYFAQWRKIQKFALTLPSITTTFVRERLKLHARGICSIKRDGKLYFHRLCDDPAKSGVFIPEDDLYMMTLHDFHRGKVIYLNRRSDIEQPIARIHCENVLVLEFPLFVPSWAYSPDSSRFIYIGDSEIVYTFDTVTMKFLPLLNIISSEDDMPIRLAYIVGIFKGVATLKYLKSNSKWYEATAQLPEGYFEKNGETDAT